MKRIVNTELCLEKTLLSEETSNPILDKIAGQNSGYNGPHKYMIGKC